MVTSRNGSEGVALHSWRTPSVRNASSEGGTEDEAIFAAESPPRIAIDAYHRGRWDLVLKWAEPRHGKSCDVELASLALRDWSVARRCIAGLSRSMGWTENAYAGFCHLDLSALPPRPEQAIRRMRRGLLADNTDGNAAASVASSFDWDERESVPWVEHGLAEDRLLAEAVHRLDNRQRMVRALIAPSGRTTEEAYRCGRWDIALQLAETEKTESSQSYIISALINRDWALSDRLIGKFAQAMGWPKGTFRGFGRLDRRWLPHPNDLFTPHRLPPEEDAGLYAIGRSSGGILAALCRAVVARQSQEFGGRGEDTLSQETLAALDEGVGPAEAQIVGALLRSGLIGHARRYAEATIADIAGPQEEPQLVQLGKWAMTAGRYDLAIPLLRKSVYADLGSRYGVLEYVELLHRLSLAYSLLSPLRDLVSDRLDGQAAPSSGERYLSALVSELRDRLAIAPPPQSIVAAVSRLLPSVVPTAQLELKPLDDEKAAAARFSRKLLRRLRSSPREWLLAAITGGDVRLPPSSILSALGNHLLQDGRWREALQQFDRAINVADSPVEENGSQSARRLLIMESYRQHRVLYYKGSFYAFHVHAPEPALQASNTKLSLLKNMIATVLASLLPEALHRPLLGMFRALTKWVHTLRRIGGLALSHARAAVWPLWRVLKFVLRPATRLTRWGVRRSTRLTAWGVGETKRAAALLLRIFRSLVKLLPPVPEHRLWLLDTRIAAMRQALRSNETVYRLRYWRRYPLYRADTLDDLLARVDVAVASGRVKRH
jgi:tetratricopeptide (TPR) repeat protein